MAREYLKKATLTASSGASDVHETVTNILADIEAGGDEKALEYAAKFDRYEGNILLSEAEIAALHKSLTRIEANAARARKADHAELSKP